MTRYLAAPRHPARRTSVASVPGRPTACNRRSRLRQDFPTRRRTPTACVRITGARKIGPYGRLHDSAYDGRNRAYDGRNRRHGFRWQPKAEAGTAGTASQARPGAGERLCPGSTGEVPRGRRRCERDVRVGQAGGNPRRLVLGIVSAGGDAESDLTRKKRVPPAGGQPAGASWRYNTTR